MTHRALVDIDPSSVRLLLSIIDLGSISKGARRHGYSQPSASRRVRDLERRLGLPLLERGTTGARLTTDGARLVEDLRTFVLAGDHLLEAAAATAVGGRQAVAVAVSPASVRFDLPVLGGLLRGRRPDIELDLTLAETIEAASGTRDGHFELAIVDGPSCPIGLSDHLLVERWMDVVVGLGHPWWGRQVPVDVDELTSTPLWLPARGTGSRDVIEAAINLAGGSGLSSAGTGDDDLRLNQTLLGPNPAIVRREWIEHSGVVADRIRVVPTVVRLVQPVRMVWKGRQPGSAAAFTVWHQIRSSGLDFDLGSEQPAG